MQPFVYVRQEFHQFQWSSPNVGIGVYTEVSCHWPSLSLSLHFLFIKVNSSFIV